MHQKEEFIIPYELKTHLSNIIGNKMGYLLGEPWKYSEEALGVVVPILRENSPDREYITMYEVLDQLNMKDTGHINLVELQNNSGKAIFVRAGTIFAGKTQNRAVQHSGVYQEKTTNINVNCVYQTHGIRKGEEMKFGDIAPPSITMNLMTGNQSKVWESVHRYTSGGTGGTTGGSEININPPSPPPVTTNSQISENLSKAYESIQRYGDNWHGVNCEVRTYREGTVRISRVKPSEGITQIWRGSLSEKEIEELNKYANNINSSSRGRTRTYGFMSTSGSNYSSSSTMGTIGSLGQTYSTSFTNYRSETSSDNLLEHLQKIKDQSILDDMMQRVPLFNNQVGAIIFNPVGVIAIETFDHPKSWESIKKDIIEKYGDKIKNEQAEHLFELKPEMILPALRNFIKGLDKFTERIIKKDDHSETREIIGEGIIGEYTLVKGEMVHVLLLRKN